MCVFAGRLSGPVDIFQKYKYQKKFSLPFYKIQHQTKKTKKETLQNIIYQFLKLESD